jgi:hypothetical protein
MLKFPASILNYKAFSLLFAFVSLTALSAPPTFNQAKIEARQYVYHDQTKAGTFYCGCNWKWVGHSGGHVHVANGLEFSLNVVVMGEWLDLQEGICTVLSAALPGSSNERVRSWLVRPNLTTLGRTSQLDF